MFLSVLFTDDKKLQKSAHPSVSSCDSYSWFVHKDLKVEISVWKIFYISDGFQYAYINISHVPGRQEKLPVQLLLFCLFTFCKFAWSSFEQ